MTTFTVERTGTPIRLAMTYTSNDSASGTVRSSKLLTQTGDVLQSVNGECFLVGEHDLTGIQCRASVPHYRISLFRVTRTLTILREGKAVASDLPSVVSASSPQKGETPAYMFSGQNFRIAIPAVDIRKKDEVLLGGTGGRLRVEAVDSETWEGKLFLVYGSSVGVSPLGRLEASKLLFFHFFRSSSKRKGDVSILEVIL